jgi:hypothetical protein
MSKKALFFKPISKAEEWKYLLAKPNKQWKTGYSAKTLAYCWQENNDFPEEVKLIFSNSRISAFQNVELVVAFPEYKVPLPGGIRPSQNDKKQLISIAVEGKVSESFGELISDWKNRDGGGKQIRLQFLCNTLGLEVLKINNIRYQLLHRAASAIIEASRFNAQIAVMLVHSFSTSNEWFDDYQSFLALFGKKGKLNCLTFAKKIGNIKLYLGWVEGNLAYLKK